MARAGIRPLATKGRNMLEKFHLKSSIACLTVGAVIGASAAFAAQPHMVNALGSLQAAHTELVRAESNKGGHRERAIGLVEQAIAETRAGIAYAGN
jgi:hypothetical protein